MPDTSVDPVRRIRVLIVEDDELQSQILGAALSNVGFEIETVGGGMAAVWKVREGKFDIVLIDYQLPDIDGLATAKLVGDLMGQIARPVLIGLTSSPERLNARENGVESAYDAIVGKSSDFAALQAMMMRCLESAPDSTTRREAEFSLLLDSWRDYDTEVTQSGGSSDDAGPPHILIVEDDEVQGLLLKAVLEQQGYIAEITPSGLDAVLKIRGGRYDLALVDYGLLEMDGLAAGTFIRDLMQEAKRPRLIALTATPALLNEAQATTPSVFDEVRQKSSDLQGLIRSVDYHLRSSSNPTTRRAAAFTPNLGD